MFDQNESYGEKIENYKKVLINFLQNGGTFTKEALTKLEYLQKDLKLDNRGIALAYSSLGHEKLYNQNFDVATKLFRDAIHIYEETPAAYAGWGYILYIQGKREEAIKKLKKSEKLFQEQNMYSEAEQIEEYLMSIADNDNWWKKFKIAIGIDNGLENQPQILLPQKLGSTYHIYGTIGILTEGNKYHTHEQVHQNIYPSEQKHTLAEAAEQIQTLLKVLEKTNPTATEMEKKSFVTSAINPEHRSRIVKALEAGGEKALEEFLKNPYINVGVAIVKEWQKNSPPNQHQR